MIFGVRLERDPKTLINGFTTVWEENLKQAAKDNRKNRIVGS
jgi:hypothetical protein